MTVHNNQEQLILWKESKLYSGSRYKVDQGYWQDYDDWLDDNDTGTKLTLDIYRQTITEPMKLTQSLPNMDGYTYGKLSNAGKWYYIFIDRVTTDQYGTSTIEYSIDWWATEWTNINCTKAHLTRKPTKPGYMAQPYTPLNVTAQQQYITVNYCIMATYIPSEDNVQSYISTVILEGTTDNLKMVEEGYWYQKLGIAGSDVKDCFIVPVFSISDFRTQANSRTIITIDVSISGSTTSADDIIAFVDWLRAGHYGYDNSKTVVENLEDYYTNLYFYNKRDGKYYELEYMTTVPIYNYAFVEITDPSEDYNFVRKANSGYLDSDDDLILYDYLQSKFTDEGSNFWNSTKQIYESFTTTETQVQGIIDWNGEIVWDCPYGVTIPGFFVKLNVGLSNIMLEFLPTDTNILADKNTGKGFTYSCKHPPLFTDSYQEYVLKNRDYDIAMREIQSDKQLWTSVTSMFENIGFGFAFGDSATAHKGGGGSRLPYGAIAAGVGSLINTIGTFAINSTFDPQIQQQYDNRYRRMTDQVALVGDALTNMYRNRPLYRYSLTMDTATQNRMNDDISMNGYYCDEVTTNLDSYLHRGNVIQADNITVEGAVQLECRYQVVNRLMNGVEFI